MNVSTAREEIYCRLLDANPGDEEGAIPITLDNEDFDEPLNTPWMRLTVRTNIRRQNTLGKPLTRRFRTFATAYIQVYTPSNSGLAGGDKIAIDAANLFEGVSFNGLDFRAVTIRESGVNGKWFQHMVEANFDYDETR